MEESTIPPGPTSAPLAHESLEIRIECPPVLSGYLQELLWTLDHVDSVAEYYRNDRDGDQTRPSDLTHLGVFTRDADGEARVHALLAANPRLMQVCRVVETRRIEEKDWAESWKQHWHPTPVTERLLICPTWEQYQPKRTDEAVIRLDPECAFGTGTHETTQLMLKALEMLADRTDLARLALLDVGTGSGILAIYAAMRGCRNVRGIDIDPLAVETARKNAERNGVATGTDFSETPLDALCHTRYDVICANIIAPVILELLPEMLLRLNPEGTLLVSGLIESSVGDVEAAMRTAGFTDVETIRQGDWFLLSGVYQSDRPSI